MLKKLSILIFTLILMNISALAIGGGDGLGLTCGDAGNVIAGTMHIYQTYVPLEIPNTQSLDLLNSIDAQEGTLTYDEYRYLSQPLFMVILTLDNGNTVYVVDALYANPDQESENDMLLLVFDETITTRSVEGEIVEGPTPCIIYEIHRRDVLPFYNSVIEGNTIQLDS